jgi:uncharacterized protein (DUF2336 family)
MSRLTIADANTLVLDPSSENREQTAIKITELFKSKALDAGATGTVEEILRIFAHDAAIRVRKAVSQQLQHEPDLPEDVALALAQDVDDVAVPVLRFSRALSDADLAELAASEGQTKLYAMAARHQVGPVLSDALIDHGDETTVATLLANAGSRPTEAGMMTALDRFSESDLVQAPLARRTDVPPAVLVRMITLVSDHVLKELSSRKDLPADLAADIIAQAEERAFVGLADEHADPAEMVAHLVKADRLTSNLAVRGLVSGDFDFFEHAMAHLAGMKMDVARSLIHDAGTLGVKELCRKASTPDRSTELIVAAISTAKDLGFEDCEMDRQRFQPRMIERMLTHFEDLGDHLEVNGVDDLIDQLRMPNAAPASAA